jgi:3-oxoacyl-[acyl-carrier protein] reductase
MIWLGRWPRLKLGIRAHPHHERNKYGTRGLARDLGPRGITVNTVQPGPVDTDANPADGPFAEMLKGYLALKRYANADEIAGIVAYLASSEAGFVTGASLTIDGGFAA